MLQGAQAGAHSYACAYGLDGKEYGKQGAYDKHDACGGQYVAYSNQWGNNSAEGKTDSTEQCRCRTGIFASAVHGKRGRRGESEAEHEDDCQQQQLVHPEATFKP